MGDEWETIKPASSGPRQPIQPRDSSGCAMIVILLVLLSPLLGFVILKGSIENPEGAVLFGMTLVALAWNLAALIAPFAVIAILVLLLRRH